MTERTAGRQLQRRNATLAAEQPLCQLCLVEQRVTEGAESDHIVPLSQGGPDTAENLWRLCKLCHDAKTLLDCDRRHRPEIGADGWPSGPPDGLTDKQIAEVKERQAGVRRVRGGGVRE